MANFNTHLVGAASLSGLLSTTLVVALPLSPVEGIALWGAGILGGFLPDIDSDASPILRGIFTVLGFIGACFSYLLNLSLALLPTLGVTLAIFLLIRFGAMYLFAEFSRHRGSFHSILAGITFGALTTLACWQIGGLHINLSWLLGGMLFFGFIVHLLLDEIFAVNLSSMELKSSFGTALKPFSLKYWKASLLFLAVGTACFWYLPAPTGLAQIPGKLAQIPLY